MRTMLLFATILIALTLSAPAGAQTIPVNPSGVEWTVATVEDHNNTLRYKLNIYDLAGGAMVRVVTIVGAMIDTTTLKVATTWNAMPLAFGDYEAAVQACWDDAQALEQCSAESDRSNEFRRRPGKPGGLVVLP